MTDTWYEVVEAGTSLTQSDLIFACPVLAWESGTLELEGRRETEVLRGATIATASDVVVMTQACDLEHKNVENVILCPHVSLAEHYTNWKENMEGSSQNPTKKAWGAHCEEICKGFMWNVMMLNHGQIDGYNLDIRIVYFDEVFTVPISFLESLVEKRAISRFRLLPPYREDLSQAFARFFMRVGLPVPI